MKRLLAQLSERGIRLRLDGDQVAFTGPKGAMTPELLRELRAKKSDLRDYLLLERRRATGEAPSAAGSDLSLDPERAIADALEAEGGGDLGVDGADLREALAVYVESVERDARPHGLGRIYLYERILKLSLLARIRLARTQAASGDEARGGKLRHPPLLVCGLPRSGTTLLHRLLALADDAAGLPLWQLLEPLPPARGPDQRHEHATRNITWLNGLVSVSLDAQHYVRPDLPDECGHLLRASFRGSMPWQAPATSWLAWSLRADASPAYRTWAAFLARLEPDDRRLVLKDPFHMGYLETIRAVCPDARVVQTHRDPLEVVPSFHKLCHTMHAVLSPEPDRAKNVAAQTAWLADLVEKNAVGRAAFPPRQLLDVDYRVLVADPIAEVTRVHAFFGLPLTEAHLARMRAFLAENGQRKHGDNRYSAGDFGQTRDEIAERFAGYRRRFDLDRPR